jgi:hypothetical protein
MNKFVAQYNKLLKDRNEAEDSEEHKNRQVKRRVVSNLHEFIRSVIFISDPDILVFIV